MEKTSDITIKSLPKISIIFPNYNGGDEPLSCIASIKQLNYPNKKIEVIVIDNHSTDGSDININKLYPRITLLRMDENLGFARAINTGIRKSSGDYIFIGNDDIIFGKNSLLNMINHIQKHKHIGIIGGKIFLKDKPSHVASPGYMMSRWTGNIYPAPEPEVLKTPDWVQGCAMLLPKKLIKKLVYLMTNFH